MLKIFVFSFFLFFLLSCSKTGDEYYTDSSGDEGTAINYDTLKKKLFFDVAILNNVFTVDASYKLMDSVRTNDNYIEDIHFTVNNVTDSLAYKKYLYCGNEKEAFTQISDIGNLTQLASSGAGLDFTYLFDKNKIDNINKIKVEVSFKFKEDGNDKNFTKTINMTRHDRYKSWFLSH